MGPHHPSDQSKSLSQSLWQKLSSSPHYMNVNVKVIFLYISLSYFQLNLQNLHIKGSARLFSLSLSAPCPQGPSNSYRGPPGSVRGPTGSIRDPPGSALSEDLHAPSEAVPDPSDLPQGPLNSGASAGAFEAFSAAAPSLPN